MLFYLQALCQACYEKPIIRSKIPTLAILEFYQKWRKVKNHAKSTHYHFILEKVQRLLGELQIYGLNYGEFV